MSSPERNWLLGSRIRVRTKSGSGLTARGMRHGPAPEEVRQGRTPPKQAARAGLRTESSCATRLRQAAAGGSARLPATLGELPVQRLWARTDRARDPPPGAPRRNAAPVPRDPRVEALRDGSKGEDLCPKARRPKLLREVKRPRFGESGIGCEQRTDGRSRDDEGARWHDGHAVAVVVLGEDGSLGEHHARTSTLQHERAAIRAVTDEVSLARHQEMEDRDLVIATEEMRTRRELPCRRVEGLEPFEQGHEPDSYHARTGRVHAPCTGSCPEV